MEEEVLPKQQIYIIPLNVAEMVQWKGMVPTPPQDLAECSWEHQRTALGTSKSRYVHAWGLLPKPYLRAGISTRQWRFEIRVFLPLLSFRPSSVSLKTGFATLMSGDGLGAVSMQLYLTHAIWCLTIYIKWELMIILSTHQCQMTNQSIFH